MGAMRPASVQEAGQYLFPFTDARRVAPIRVWVWGMGFVFEF